MTTAIIGSGKPRRYASIKAVLAQTFKEMGGVKRVCHLLKLGKSRAYAFTDPDHVADIGFSAVCELVRAGSKAPVEFLCTLAGGAFHPGEASNEDLDALAVRCLQRHTGFLAAVIGKSDPKDTLLELDELIRAATQARAHVIREIEIH